MSTKKKNQDTCEPVLLCILDGWGEGKNTSDNAIHMAKTPHWDGLVGRFPHSLLETSGLAVGLPEGQMGNSEVGHMNIGSGRVVMQNLPRIDRAITDGSLAAHPDIQSLITQLKQTNRVCHLLGLVSPGGVHSHQNHIIALAKIVANAGVKVNIHAFLDGRDTPPSSAQKYMTQLEEEIAGQENIAVATISGRYYAMDRDNRWDRVALAYDTIVSGEGGRLPNASKAINNSYITGKTDEFVMPAVVGNYRGISDGDGMVMVNFRSDRARQLLHALVDPKFTGFERKRVIKFATILGMVEYSTALNPYITTLFTPELLKNILGEVVADAGKKQLRISETEKYAHVTFFFNGGKEEVLDGEDRILIPSPDVATYDLKPEMSATEVTDKLLKAINSKKYSLIIVNYANTDMVGHTGNMEAAVKAIEAVDGCLGRLSESILDCNGVMLVTADHGNAEQMLDETTGQPHTAHTENPVPLVMVAKDSGIQSLENGKLCDIAPTILELLALPKPDNMTGISLLKKKVSKAA